MSLSGFLKLEISLIFSFHCSVALGCFMVNNLCVGGLGRYHIVPSWSLRNKPEGFTLFWHLNWVKKPSTSSSIREQLDHLLTPLLSKRQAITSVSNRLTNSHKAGLWSSHRPPHPQGFIWEVSEITLLSEDSKHYRHLLLSAKHVHLYPTHTLTPTETLKRHASPLEFADSAYWLVGFEQ